MAIGFALAALAGIVLVLGFYLEDKRGAKLGVAGVALSLFVFSSRAFGMAISERAEEDAYTPFSPECALYGRGCPEPETPKNLFVDFLSGLWTDYVASIAGLVLAVVSTGAVFLVAIGLALLFGIGTWAEAKEAKARESPERDRVDWGTTGYQGCYADDPPRDDVPDEWREEYIEGYRKAHWIRSKVAQRDEDRPKWDPTGRLSSSLRPTMPKEEPVGPGPWLCDNCGHRGQEQEFAPHGDERVCPKCGAFGVFVGVKASEVRR